MDGTRRIWPAADTAIAVLLLKDNYANARLHYVTRMVTALVVALAVSFLGIFALINRPPQFMYVLTDNLGRVLPMVPMDRPNHPDEYVVSWTVDAVTRLYSFDFVNYRTQLQDAKVNLTTSGWKSFEAAMKESNNFNAVLGNRYVTTAVPTGAGRIIKTGDVMGRHAWKVEFPMLISYRSSLKDSQGRQRVTSQQLNMSVTVIRQPEFLNEAGLGIRAIVAE